MNVHKVVYTDPVGKCGYGIRAAYIDLRIDRVSPRFHLFVSDVDQQRK